MNSKHVINYLESGCHQKLYIPSFASSTVSENPHIFHPYPCYYNSIQNKSRTEMEVLLSIDVPPETNSVFVSGTFNGWKKDSIPLTYV